VPSPAVAWLQELELALAAAASCLPLLHSLRSELSLARPCALFAASPSRGVAATAGAAVSRSRTSTTSAAGGPREGLGSPVVVTVSRDPQNRTLVGRFVG